MKHLCNSMNTLPNGRYLIACSTMQSLCLDRNGQVFIKCTARILSNFGMTRGGPFKGIKITKNGNVNHKEILLDCWNEVRDRLLEIHNSVLESSYSRGRYLLELSKPKRERLIAEIWIMTKISYHLQWEGHLTVLSEQVNYFLQFYLKLFYQSTIVNG